MSTIDPSRLYTQLQNTGLANKDSPLYQLIRELIGTISKINIDVNGLLIPSGSGTPSSTSGIIQQLQGFFDIDGGSYYQGDDNGLMIGPPGIPGLDGPMVPYHILPAEIFTVPLYKQALFAMNILNEGMLVVDGFLIEVDRSGSGGSGTPGIDGLSGPPGLNGEDGYDNDNWLLGVSTETTREITITTTGNIDNLDFGNANLIRMNNASLSTIQGLKAGKSGQLVTIVSIGAGQVNIANQNTNSLAGNRFITFVTSAPTPLAPGAGAIVCKYDGTTERWRLISHNQGAVITPTFAAGDFTASSGSWSVDSGDVSSCAYYLTGKVLLVIFQIDATSVSATPAQLIIGNGAWGGFTAPVIAYSVGHVYDGGVFKAANCFVSGSGFYFTKLDGVAFATSVNGTYARQSASFAIT